ncbi:MAG: lipoate--protein ligase family protein [Chloroflexota bacterium]
MRQYRLIIDRPTIGARNMAIDEAIMNAVVAGAVLPTLRFYAWDPACLSLGYGQQAADADLDRIATRGWALVRRATGGRAILHTDELTYSLTLPEAHPLAAGGIIESYRRISRALLAGLSRLGVDLSADRRAAEHKLEGPVCFEVPSHYEVTTSDGRKLIGSAQLRRRGGVLQHGSLPLVGDLGRIVDALDFPDEAAREAARMNVRGRAATLADAFDGRIFDFDTVADALAHGFATTFDAELIPGALTPAEQAEAEQLAAAVYGSAAWTYRK